MKYKISIIIPVHNIEKYLENTLNSLLNQSIGFENLEVILVDDNSTDGTKDIIYKYVSEYENFKGIYLTENSGLPGKPRNIGIENATSDYIMFMDHDDYYAKDFCEVLYGKITKENVDMVFCRYNYVFLDGQIQRNPNTLGDVNEIKAQKINDEKRLLTLAPSLWTKIFRKEFILNNDMKFPEGMLAEDLYFVTHALLKAQGIIYLNNYFGYNYRIRNSEIDKSTIYIRNKKYLHSMISGYSKTFEILKKEKKEEFFPIIFEGHLKYWLSCFVFSSTSKSEKKDLLNEIGFFFKKQGKYGFDADESYLALFDKIKNKEYDNAILISEIIYFFKDREQKFNKKFINSQKTNQELHKQLKSRKDQVAELQTTMGWLKYKFNNIYARMKFSIKKRFNQIFKLS